MAVRVEREGRVYRVFLLRSSGEVQAAHRSVTGPFYHPGEVLLELLKHGLSVTEAEHCIQEVDPGFDAPAEIERRSEADMASWRRDDHLRRERGGERPLGTPRPRPCGLAVRRPTSASVRQSQVGSDTAVYPSTMCPIYGAGGRRVKGAKHPGGTGAKRRPLMRCLPVSWAVLVVDPVVGPEHHRNPEIGLCSWSG